jgi:hypothetical protein
MVEDKDIANFKRLYSARFGVELDDEMARRKLIALLKQMEVVYQPIKRKDALNVNGDDNEQDLSELHI